MNLFTNKKRVGRFAKKPGCFIYQSVPNVKEAERLQAIGWKVIVAGSSSFLMESPKRKKI